MKKETKTKTKLDWQGKSKRQIMFDSLMMYLGFLGIIGTILFLFIKNL